MLVIFLVKLYNDADLYGIAINSCSGHRPPNPRSDVDDLVTQHAHQEYSRLIITNIAMLLLPICWPSTIDAFSGRDKPKFHVMSRHDTTRTTCSNWRHKFGREQNINTEWYFTPYL